MAESASERAGTKMGLTFLLGITRVGPARKKLSLYWSAFNKSFIDHASSGWLDIGLVPF